MSVLKPFPFLYYGNRPVVWETPFHSWEIRFQEVPDEATRETLARTVARCSHGALFYLSGWFWADEWAGVDTGPQNLAEPDLDAFFAQHEEMFRAIHGVAPLAEVVHLNSTRRGTSDWDAWSHRQQAWPTSPHPAWPAMPLRRDRRYGLHDGYSEPEGVEPSAMGEFDRGFMEAVRRAAQNIGSDHLEELLGRSPATDAARVETTRLPRPDASNVFEAALIAERASGLALELTPLFGGILPGSWSDGAGNLYCPAFSTTSPQAAVVLWVHDSIDLEHRWLPAAESFAQLEAMDHTWETFRDGGLEVDDVFLALEQEEHEIRGLSGLNERLDSIVDAEVRSQIEPLLTAWAELGPGLVAPPSPDFMQADELIDTFIPEAATGGPGRASEAVGLLQRAAWQVAALVGGDLDVPASATLEVASGAFTRAVSDSRLASKVPNTLYWLWWAWFVGEAAHLDAILPIAKASPSRLVRDAAKLALELRSGRLAIGDVPVPRSSFWHVQAGGV